jgi:hypothetical protein
MSVNGMSVDGTSGRDRASVDATSASPAVQRLAHTLGVPTTRLVGLASVPEADVHALREQVVDMLFRADKPAFIRVAALAKSVPVGVSARLAEAVLPPLLAARAAQLIDPGKAADLVQRLPQHYVADVAQAMEPSRAPELLRQLPGSAIARVAAELATRGEWVVIAGFVAEVSTAALSDTIAVLSGEQLLRISAVLEDTSRLDEIAGMVSDDQVDEMVVAATTGLSAEFDHLRAHLRPETRARLEQRAS